MFDVTQGEDANISIKLKYASGARFDLTGKTISAKVTIAGVLTTLTTPTDVEVVNALDGDIIVNLTDSQTPNLEVGDLPIDVYVVEGSDTKIFRIRNQVMVNARLT